MGRNAQTQSQPQGKKQQAKSDHGIHHSMYITKHIDRTAASVNRQGSGKGGSAMAELKVKLQILHGEDIAFGPGKADLLDAVAQTGSIAAAGRALGLSYRRTRDMIDTLNHCWRGPLVETAKGGSSHGGTVLTPLGQQVLTAYRTATAELRSVADRHASLLGMLRGPEQ